MEKCLETISENFLRKKRLQKLWDMLGVHGFVSTALEAQTSLHIEPPDSLIGPSVTSYRFSSKITLDMALQRLQTCG